MDHQIYNISARRDKANVRKAPQSFWEYLESLSGVTLLDGVRLHCYGGGAG